MIFVCADDYGISKESSERIALCAQAGVLNKVSILPNGDIGNFEEHLGGTGVKLSLHLNLVEGYPLSKPEDVNLLIGENGSFQYSFIGLWLLSLSRKRKQLKEQLRHELGNQIRFWKQHIGPESPMCIDSHQHTHMIPLVFKALMEALKENDVTVDFLRFPAEPLLPYLLEPSLYLTYSPVNLVKQWLLKFFGLINERERKKANIKREYLMGVLFSGSMDARRVPKVLKHYLQLAEKRKRDIELLFHPGYSQPGEKLICGNKQQFDKFYFSPGRRVEFETLMQLKLVTKEGKEG